MNQNEVRNFVMALSNISQYVPPMLFNQITSSPVGRVLEQVANGQAIVDVKVVTQPQANGAGAGQQDQESAPQMRQ